MSIEAGREFILAHSDLYLKHAKKKTSDRGVGKINKSATSQGSKPVGKKKPLKNKPTERQVKPKQKGDSSTSPGWDESKVKRDARGQFAAQSEQAQIDAIMNSEMTDEEKLAAINELIAEKEANYNEAEYRSLDELPKRPIQTFKEVLETSHFEYTDWEDPNQRIGNCAFSTFAYELQRRGYNVEAKTLENAMGSNIDIRSVQYWENLRSPEMDQEVLSKYANKPTTYDMYSSTPVDSRTFRTPDELVNYINTNPKNFPPKSRGMMEITGHVYNYEVSPEGKLYFIDGQRGGLYGQGQLGTNQFTEQAFNSEFFTITRTDDKEINPKYLDLVREADDSLNALYYERAQLQSGGRSDIPGLDQYYEEIVEDILDNLERRR